MKNKRIVTCAVTGGIHVPTMSEYLPVTPEEIAQNAIDAANAGASVVHIHGRDPQNGMPTFDLNIYQDIQERIRAKNKDVVICISTGGSPQMTIEQRVASVPAFKPELASLNLGSINFGIHTVMDKIKDFKYPWEPQYLMMGKNAIFQNTFADLEAIVKIMYDNGTKPELEAYDVGHIYNCEYLLQKGFLKPPVYLQFVTGILGGISSTPYDLVNLHLTADRVLGKDNYQWSVIGAGRQEFPMCVQGLLLGGNVRVGMEDNLFISKGVLAKSNAELVEKMVRIMRELDLEPASPDEARKTLNLFPESFQ